MLTERQTLLATIRLLTDRHQIASLPELKAHIEEIIHYWERVLADYDAKPSRSSRFWNFLRPFRRNVNTKLERLLLITERTEMKVSELAGALDALNTKVDKVRTEVQALKDSLGDVDLPPAAAAALARLETAIQGVDDVNPDAPA